MSLRVHVLLPVHNRRAVTEECIKCLARQTFPDLHLVLIDDGCTDGTAEMVAGYFPAATVLRGAGDWWWGGSLHQGYHWLRRSEASPDDVVLILNDDTSFEPAFVQLGVTALAKHERSLLLANLYDAESNEFIEAGVHVDWATMSFRPVADPAQINCFSTRGLFMRVRDMLEIGGFHPRLLPHYASDYEYTLRARRKGFALRSAPEVLIWLKGHTTGIREWHKQDFRPFLRTAFSKRSLQNPLYWTTFVLLCCPVRFVPRNLWQVWIGFLRQARHALFLPPSVERALAMVSRLRRWLSRLRYRAGLSLAARRQATELRQAIRASPELLRIVVGASGTGFPGWVSTEYPLVNITDGNSLRRFFREGSARAVLAEHVLEHLTAEQAAAAARNLYWLLASGGYARIAVPDALHTDPAYIEYSRPGGSGMGSEDHKVFYDYRSLGAMFAAAGFEVRNLEWFDESGTFHAVTWDPSDGMVVRSTRFDDRNRVNPTAFTSLIIDAIKPTRP